ncbi:unnamed protein product [Cylicocyclus nassatus]|uniref:RRM domain-containing protein n=1 Tax=Cylicocyclus nassatus TaxID=53992 RepID=A0AA36GRU3_CYLNA|nr:unnamed protein product [Cylicocyclus nassatus]
MSDEEDRTCYVCNFSHEVTSDLLEELFTQVGPLEKVSLTEKNGHRFAMVLFEDDVSVPFAVETLDGIHMFGIPLTVKPRSGSKHDKRRSFDSKRRDTYLPHSSSYPESHKRDYNGRITSYEERHDNHYRGSPYTPSMALPTPPPPPPPPPLPLSDPYPSLKIRPVARSDSSTPKSSFKGRPGNDQRRTFPTKPSDTRIFEAEMNGRERWHPHRGGRDDRFKYRNSSFTSRSGSSSSLDYRRY